MAKKESHQPFRRETIVAKAMQLLGSREAAEKWLQEPTPSLDGEAPFRRARTEVGAEEVLKLIGRLEHGIPA